MIAALYPAVLLLLQALVALGVGWLVLWLGSGLPLGLNWVLAALAGYAVLEGFRRIDRRLYVYYLMHDYAFTGIAAVPIPRRWRSGWPSFANVCGWHLPAGWMRFWSSVIPVAFIWQSPSLPILSERGRRRLPRLGFLSLGHAVPMASFLPKAGRLRADLAYLSQSDAN
jgi:hypothetical protein